MTEVTIEQKGYTECKDTPPMTWFRFMGEHDVCIALGGHKYLNITQDTVVRFGNERSLVKKISRVEIKIDE